MSRTLKLSLPLPALFRRPEPPAPAPSRFGPVTLKKVEPREVFGQREPGLKKPARR